MLLLHTEFLKLKKLEDMLECNTSQGWTRLLGFPIQGLNVIELRMPAAEQALRTVDVQSPEPARSLEMQPGAGYLQGLGFRV